ncbi:MAG: hypothetical protein K8R69_11070 [Deltaproteobacteria bacterium]|nr:hypothetical protein [Deltaproteobacteria bacterium]
MTTFGKIIVNGKEVDAQNVQGLPEAFQKIMVDANGNGIPDFLEGILENPLVKKAMANAGVQNFQQLPPEMRAKLEGLMQKFGNSGAMGASTMQVGTMSAGNLSSPAPSTSSTIDWKERFTPEEPGAISVKTVIFGAVAVFGFLLVAGIALLAFFRH